MQPLLLISMHGLGDGLHARALIRELMRDHELWVKTSWPEMYWDMPDVHLLPLNSPICWMAKNEARCAALYGKTQPPGARVMSVGYLSKMPQPGKSVLSVMCEVCNVQIVGDFRLPIAPAWSAKADELLTRLAPTKPVLIYRPPVALREANRSSSMAKLARNPDLDAYHALISGICDRYYVISLADVMDGHEWLVGPQLEADAEFHHGELDFETLAALFARAALVFCSPGFACVLAQAVSAPQVCVVGGFETAASFSAGARFSPCCFIEPVNPCGCWRPECKHDKSIDVPAARMRIEQFIAETECKPC